MSALPETAGTPFPTKDTQHVIAPTRTRFLVSARNPPPRNREVSRFYSGDAPPKSGVRAGCLAELFSWPPRCATTSSNLPITCESRLYREARTP